MDDSLSFDQEALKAGLAPGQVRFFDLLIGWKLCYFYMLGKEVDVFSRIVPEHPGLGRHRLIFVAEEAKKMYEQLKRLDLDRNAEQAGFFDGMKSNPGPDVPYYVWAPDRSQNGKTDNFYFTAEECLADELMHLFEVRMSGIIPLAQPSIIGDFGNPTVCYGSRFADGSIPAIYRGFGDGSLLVEKRRLTDAIGVLQAGR